MSVEGAAGSGAISAVPNPATGGVNASAGGIKAGKLAVAPSAGQGSGANSSVNVPSPAAQPGQPAADAQSASAKARTGRLDLGPINTALTYRMVAKIELNEAIAQKEHGTGACVANNDGCQGLVEQDAAQGRKLRETIERQAAPLLRKSTFSPGKPHLGDVTQVERRILSAYKNFPYERIYVQDAILMNQMIRLPLYLCDLSDAVKRNGELIAKGPEATDLIAVSANWVAERRPSDGPKAREKQFNRLRYLLDTITIGRKFDPQLFGSLIQKCIEALRISSNEDRTAFNAIVSDYRLRVRVE